MKIIHLSAIAFTAMILSGCVSAPTKTASIMSSPDYAIREPVTASLFPSDQAVLSDDAVAKILSSKLELPTKAKLALMKFSDGGFGAR